VERTTGFADKSELAKALAAAMMRWEGVPAISLFLDNTAAFVHDLAPDSLANAAGETDYVRVQILTPAGVLDRDKQLGGDESIGLTEFGGPEVLKVVELPEPEPGPGEAEVPVLCAPADAIAVAVGGDTRRHHKAEPATSAEVAGS
jgi:hypothetical protein